jgi:hypothetical protein
MPPVKNEQMWHTGGSGIIPRVRDYLVLFLYEGAEVVLYFFFNNFTLSQHGGWLAAPLLISLIRPSIYR